MSAGVDQEVLDSPAAQPGAVGRIPALDGLRAVAVLAVMLFHTASAPLRGGYLGVDIFFALSGFLIAGILLDQRRRSGRIYLGDFWLRRARRLAPALLLLLLLLCVARFAVPHPAADLWRADILAALAYLTNWFQVVTGADYFNQFGQVSPLLHTWSLAIEEQFYLGFALFLAFVLRRAKEHIVFASFVLATLISAVWMALIADRDPVWAYYSTGTRVQALLVGAILALAVRRSPKWWAPKPGRGRELMGWTGLAVLALALVVPPTTVVMFRGGFLVVAVASAAVIWAALAPTRVSRLLRWRPLVALGVVSYGVYLWHWPIFLWLETPGETALTRQLWAIMLSILAAVISYLVLERPIRQGRFSGLSARRQWGWYAVAAAIIAALAMLPARTPPPDQALSWPPADAIPQDILLAGDSTMFALGSRFPQQRYPDVTVGGPTRIACGLVNIEYMHEGQPVDASKCYDWPKQWLAERAERAPEVAVIGSPVWDSFDRSLAGASKAPGTSEFDAAYVAAFVEAARIAGDDGRIPVYVLGLPCMDAKIDQAILNDPQRTAYLSGLVEQSTKQTPNVHYVDLRPLTCRDDGTAVVYRNGRLLRDDGVHWTAAGAEEVWSLLLQRMLADARAETPSPASGMTQ